MTPARNLSEEQKFRSLLDSIIPSGVYFVTGKNGSGKSRFFAYATKHMRQAQIWGGYGKRLLCMSGTMHDKYPSIIYKSDVSDENTVYLGGKVNNNMVSDTAPFRTLCQYMLRNIALGWNIQAASHALARLNFEDRVMLKFQNRKEKKSEPSDSKPQQLDYMLDEAPHNRDRSNYYLEQLQAGNIRLSDMCFFRDGTAFRLAELSSGEKQYALALLGLIFCGSRDCVVFYDEPENSLHPSWQLSIVKDLVKIARDLHLGSTLIVATHSPLIASSVRNSNVYVCDLPAGQAWQRSDLYGRASDTVLREQFHLYSARSPEVAAIINQCLAYIARNEAGSRQFLEAQGELRSYNLELALDDPLFEVVATILRF